MDWRMLGRSGTAVSDVALGTVTFGLECGRDEAFAMLDAYTEAAGNLIDTGDVYADGRSETIVGEWLRSRTGAKDRCVIATKGRFPTGPGPNDLGSSRYHLRRALDASLRRLGTDHIDLYQLHAWDPLTPIDETVRVMDDAIAAGKIGAWGVSNFTGWQLMKAALTARALDVPAPITVQLQYNLLIRGIEAEMLPAARDVGAGVLAWSPLAGGWLTGKYQRDIPPGKGTRYSDNPARGVESWRARNDAARTWRVLDALREVADEQGITMSAAALAWLRQQPGVTSVLLGARSELQLSELLSTASVALEPGALARLDAASKPEFEPYPYGPGGAEQRTREISGGR